ncbi:hypothetical protein MtrunA17_Chr7g0265241 [Medicago truncatula]|uniref:Uncharacterized protein n=1 Tax=Medicago truncatula TaxID=3880 RepID=A0A396H5M2_MEDTR|nr:hypothetical protein MtrunA17_Chr7g0265241 [Medicago truncatula]
MICHNATWMTSEDQGNKKDHVGCNHSSYALPPSHPKINKATSKVIRRDSHNKSYPKASHFKPRKSPLARCSWLKIIIGKCWIRLYFNTM